VVAVTVWGVGRHDSVMQAEEFIQQYMPMQPKLLGFARSLLGSQAEAEDVLQEVYVKLWQAIQQGQRPLNASAWTMRVLRNMCLDRLKRAGTQDKPLEAAYAMESAWPDPEQQAEDREAMQQVRALMMELPEMQRAILHLRDVEGYDNHETAQVLGISTDQVKTYLCRARKKVKEGLTKRYQYGMG